VQEPYERARAKSRIAQCCGRVNLRKGDILIALRAYLDSSGKLGGKDDFITLAAVAANDDMWTEFETAWDKILLDHAPPAKYIHMREVFRLIDGFDKDKGWDHDKAFGVVDECLVYMSHLDKKRFCMFYCSVDLRAWDKLRAETYQMPDPVELCNQYCSETVLGWYLSRYRGVIDIHNDTVKYFFDKDEYFKEPFEAKAKRERELSEGRERWGIWNLIVQVSAVDMRNTPGIQAADIIAWGRNRETFTKPGDIGYGLAHILRQVVPSHSVVWDE
jgi:hypothetical protein